MLQECDQIEQCGFFARYRATSEAACDAIMALYCRGFRTNDCERRKYRLAHGTPPPDDMLPNGTRLHEDAAKPRRSPMEDEQDTPTDARL
jgi:hypothetical protein